MSSITWAKDKTGNFVCPDSSHITSNLGIMLDKFDLRYHCIQNGLCVKLAPLSQKEVFNRYSRPYVWNCPSEKALARYQHYSAISNDFSVFPGITNQ